VHGSHLGCIDPEIKGQGHAVVVTTAGMGMQVDMTALISSSVCDAAFFSS